MKKGQKVIVNGRMDGVPFNNVKGVINSKPILSGRIGITFEKKEDFYHTCDGKCKDGYGFYVGTDMVTFQNTRGIKIETEKIVVSDGELYRKILSIKMLKADKLTDLYLNSSDEIVFLSHDGKNIRCANGKDGVLFEYSIGWKYIEVEMQALLGHCHKAGDNLMQCNKTLKERKENWKGTETFII